MTGLIERETLKFFNKDYVPIFPEIRKFSTEWLDETFTTVSNECTILTREKETLTKEEWIDKRKTLLGKVLKLEFSGVYSCKIFSDEFCYKLIQEYLNYEKLGNTQIRPNSMNSYGCIMDELGMGSFFDEFIVQTIRPFVRVMAGASSEIDDHHSFLVEYDAKGKDLNLDFHTDDCELTINTCLGRKFEGGGIYFAGLLDQPETHNDAYVYDHVVGRSIFHDGKHRHGALDLESGERYNLIIWCRSSEYQKNKVL